MANIQIVQAGDAKVQPRKTRSPQHPFNIKSRPYEITPFMIAPVLPGETLSNLLMQARVISDPVLNPILGWWKEYYFCYVPLMAMVNPSLGTGNFESSDIQSMFLDETFDFGSVYEAGANAVPYYVFNGGTDWLYEAVNIVVQEYFRDEGDQNSVIENYPGAYIDRRNGFQSLLADDATGDDVELPGQDALEDATIGEHPIPDSAHFNKWEILRDAGMTDVTYEDYLRAQGVSVGRADEVDPDTGIPVVRAELVRYVRKWTYPTNHVDPSDGSPTSALSWSLTERADKRRLFKQPGFLVGVTVTRPKIYLTSQKGTLTGLLQNYRTWQSLLLREHPEATLEKITHSATAGPLQNQATQDYWLDVKDLFLYGEQFVNHAFDVALDNGLAFPTDMAGGATYADRVPTLAQVKSFFVDAAGTANFIREDGVVHLDIKSRIGSDTTPGGG